MKKIITLIITAIVCNVAIAQTNNNLVDGGNYYFITNQGIRSTDIIKLTNGTLPNELEIRAGNVIKIVGQKNDTIYFEYINFKDVNNNTNKGLRRTKKDIADISEKLRVKNNSINSPTLIPISVDEKNKIKEDIKLLDEELKSKEEIKENIINVSKTTNFYTYNKDIDNGKNKIFEMSKVDFQSLTRPYYRFFRGFKFGAYTVPIRLRLAKPKGLESNNFEFNSNLSLGANIIGRVSPFRRRENSYVDLSFGVGLTKVDLNSSNSDLGTGVYDSIDVLSPSAFTITSGALVNLARNVNFGIYLGWDFLSTVDNKANWIYNKKAWLGIGINISLSGGDAQNKTNLAGKNSGG